MNLNNLNSWFSSVSVHLLENGAKNKNIRKCSYLKCLTSILLVLIVSSSFLSTNSLNADKQTSTKEEEKKYNEQLKECVFMVKTMVFNKLTQTTNKVLNQMKNIMAFVSWRKLQYLIMNEYFFCCQRV